MEQNSNRATYSPEDNKLRLYIGRVPREEFLRLREEGWVTLHKQREAGGGDFAATWTPDRRDTALRYADIIEDEDMGPDERAADRAERFGEYRDKRTAEATGHADKFDAGPQAHGYQSQARAERAAARHDRIAGHALDAWSKAEYWQRRTAGVIAHALYKSSAGVRMGRIKTLEAELRKRQKSLEEYENIYSDMKKIAAITDPAKQTEQALHYTGTRNLWGRYMHPRAAEHPNEYRRTNKLSLYDMLSDKDMPITGAQAVELFFAHNSEPEQETDWTRHLKLRIAYENQMLEAQGGRAEQVEMVVGGFIGGKQIHKVNKSPATGRIVSVAVMGEHTGFTKESGYKKQETRPCLVQISTERLPANSYRPPTDEELKAFKEEQKARKAAAPKKAPCPLINPTDEDAERLIAIWNEERKARYDKSENRHYSAFKPCTIERVTQAVYSANSKGSHARAETKTLCAPGEVKLMSDYYHNEEYNKKAKAQGPGVCQIRTAGYDPLRVIILTDKPQKPLPAALWEKITPPAPQPTKATQAELLTA